MADKLEMTKEDIRQVVAVYMENLLTHLYIKFKQFFNRIDYILGKVWEQS